MRVVRLAVAMSVLMLALAAAGPALWAGVPVASTSSIWVVPDTTEAGDTVDVYVVIRDVYGEPIPDLPCTFYSDRPDTDIVIGSPDVTDIDGAAQARVTRNGNFYPNIPRLSHISVDCEGVVIGPVTVAWLCMSGVDGGSTAAAALHAVSPNPFRSATDVRYTVARSGSVRLAIFDIAGRQVRTFAPGVVEAGEHSLRWDGRDADGARVPAGVYYLRMTAPGFEASRSLILLD